MKGDIFILSAPIRVGKTTLIEQFIAKNKALKFGGFLTPDSQLNGRQLWDVNSQTYHRLQVSINDIPKNHQEAVGRFVFDKRVWEKVMQTLDDQWDKDYVVLDEIGKLEVDQNRGIHEAFVSFLEKFRQKEDRPHLIILVRNSLLDRAIEKYHLQDALINEGPWFDEDTALMGLLIAGGQSSRMGKDKALIEYHGMPQWQYVEQQLGRYCSSTIINRNDARLTNKNLMNDSADFSGHGPISGLLTAVSEYPDKSFFVMGVDYPLVKSETLNDLLQTYRIRNQSVCFKNPISDMLEPLCAIYHSNDLKHIFDWFNNGNDSLRRFLESRNPIILKPTSIGELKSFDTPHDQIQYRAR